MSFIAVPRALMWARTASNALLKRIECRDVRNLAADQSGTGSADPSGSLLTECI